LYEEGEGGEGEDCQEEEGEGEGGAVAVDGVDWVACCFCAALVWVEAGVEVGRHGCGRSCCQIVGGLRTTLSRDRSRGIVRLINLRDIKTTQNSSKLYVSKTLFRCGICKIKSRTPNSGMSQLDIVVMTVMRRILIQPDLKTQI
jgi:hypothetical protein